MKLTEFKFTLPEERISSEPSFFRDESKLMILHSKSGKIEHRHFKNIIEYYDEDDMFMFNDTKVFPARLIGNKEKTNAVIEVFLLRELNEEQYLWDVLVEPARKIRVGNKLYFGKDDSMVAEVIDNTTSRGRTVRFLYDGDHDTFKKELYLLGKTPIPSYLNRDPKEDDVDRYQTIYAQNEGAVVAPATGLHFSKQLLKRFEIKGIKSGFVTLHCSLGLFKDIDVDDLTKFKMDSEQIVVNSPTCTSFNETIAAGHKICAVGTSAMRALETAATTKGRMKPYDGWTNKFIFPPYDFGTANSLVANFQTPGSTMMMCQAAFGGYDAVMECYDIAVQKEYNFGCYGDSLLILPD